MSAGLIILFASCSKSSDSPAPPPPPVLKLTISNLNYEPQKIPVKLYEPNFTVTGTINYTNAQDGLAKIRITSVSPGFDLTVTVQGATQTSGTVTGFFEFTRPDAALDLPFEIQAIDGKGNVSNKLSGTLRVIIDESATSWWTVGITAPSIMNDIGWFDNKYIAVGNAGAVLLSEMGNTWNLQPTGMNNRFAAIGWSGSLYVAVGDNGSILSSPDGINWTVTNMPASLLINKVTHTGNIYAGAGNGIYTSADGLNWNRTYAGDPYYQFRSIAWSGTNYVATGLLYNMAVSP